MVFPVPASPMQVYKCTCHLLGEFDQQRVAVVNSGIKQANIWRIRRRRDGSICKVVDPILLLDCRHVGEKSGRRFWQAKFGDHAEDINRPAKDCARCRALATILRSTKVTLCVPNSRLNAGACARKRSSWSIPLDRRSHTSQVMTVSGFGNSVSFFIPKSLKRGELNAGDALDKILIFGPYWCRPPHAA